MVGRNQYFKREMWEIILYPFLFTLGIWIAIYFGWLGKEAQDSLIAYLFIGTAVNVIIFYITYKKFMPKPKRRRRKKKTKKR